MKKILTLALLLLALNLQAQKPFEGYYVARVNYALTADREPVTSYIYVFIRGGDELMETPGMKTQRYLLSKEKAVVNVTNMLGNTMVQRIPFHPVESSIEREYIGDSLINGHHCIGFREQTSSAHFQSEHRTWYDTTIRVRNIGNKEVPYGIVVFVDMTGVFEGGAPSHTTQELLSVVPCKLKKKHLRAPKPGEEMRFVYPTVIQDSTLLWFPQPSQRELLDSVERLSGYVQCKGVKRPLSNATHHLHANGHMYSFLHGPYSQPSYALNLFSAQPLAPGSYTVVPADSIPADPRAVSANMLAAKQTAPLTEGTLTVGEAPYGLHLLLEGRDSLGRRVALECRRPIADLAHTGEGRLLFRGDTLRLTSGLNFGLYLDELLADCILLTDSTYAEPEGLRVSIYHKVAAARPDPFDPGTYPLSTALQLTLGDVLLTLTDGPDLLTTVDGTLTVTASDGGPCYQLQATDEAGHSVSLRSSLSVTTLNNTGTGQFTLGGETYPINSAMQTTMVVSGFSMTNLVFTNDEAEYMLSLIRVSGGFDPGTYELGDESAILTKVVALFTLGDDEAGESLSGTLTITSTGDTYTFTLTAETTIGSLEMTYTGRVATLAKRNKSINKQRLIQ